MTSVLCDPHVVGLRWCEEEEAEIFSRWEQEERPYPWSKNQFLMTAGNQFFGTLVWPSESGLVGFAALQLVEGEAYLQNIMINKAYRGQNLGTVLMDKVFYWCCRSGATTLWLDVDTKNHPALHLYRRSGFETVQFRSSAYPHGEDATSMKRTLGTYNL